MACDIIGRTRGSVILNSWKDKKLKLTIQYLMSAVGGYMGAYTLTTGFGVFGSSQTAHMVFLSRSLANLDMGDLIHGIIGTLIYILGIILAVILPKKIGKYSMVCSAVIDITAFCVIAVLPENALPSLEIFISFFAMSFQWASFPSINGYTSATIFSTNNLRQCVSGFTEYLLSSDNEQKCKGLYYLGTLLSFNLSAFAYFFITKYANHSIIFGTIPAIIGLFAIFREISIEKNEKL